jgi:predicted XRE-type DNA-binding protein
MKKFCKVENCNKPTKQLGFCSKHSSQIARRGSIQPDLTPIEKFWSKVEKGETGECWNWKAGLSSKGYGGIKIKYHGITWNYAHKLSFYLAFGVNAAQYGLVIRHKCDNPKCVNPDHLLMGTKKENTADMLERKRNAFGEKSGTAKLSNSQVKEIKNLIEKVGISNFQIAEKFKVDRTTISKIRNKKTWTSI